jgi:putative acetyltransferase
MDHVRAFLTKAERDGVTLGAYLDERLVGEIHAARLGPRQFGHVLSDLTIAVHPEAQGRGVGARLFAAFFASAAELSPAVTRIELMVRAGNAHAIELYERLGFIREGRFAARVRLRDGRVEDDIAMALLL